MKFFNRRRRGSRLDSPAVHPEIDPNLFFSDTPHPKPDYHTQALCKVVMRTLTTALSGQCADPLLQDLLVLAVYPAPNAGHLLVVVSPRIGEATLADYLDRLARVTPLLRAQIAQDTARKRTPELSFDVLGRGVNSLEAPPTSDSDAPTNPTFNPEDLI